MLKIVLAIVFLYIGFKSSHEVEKKKFVLSESTFKTQKQLCLIPVVLGIIVLLSYFGLL